MSPDGALAEASMDPVPSPHAFDRIVDSAHARHFSTFGFRGDDRLPPEPAPVTRESFAWRWGATKKRYVLRTEVIQVPRPRQKRAATKR